MSRQNEAIEENEKFLPEAIRFDPKNNTLLLDIAAETADTPSVRAFAESKGLNEKDEFHITVLGFTNGDKLKNFLKEMTAEGREQTIVKIQSLADGMDWSFSPQPEKYFIQKDYFKDGPAGEEKEHRESVIQMVNMPGLKKFYDELNDMFGASLDIPPAHFTLFTNSDKNENSRLGIGIKSEGELQMLSPQVI